MSRALDIYRLEPAVERIATGIFVWVYVTWRFRVQPMGVQLRRRWER